jgi:hypothetical protein
MKNKLSVYLLALSSLTATAGHAAVATFDDLALASDSAFNPSMDSTFNSGDAAFVYNWNETYNCCWSGFTYSNMTGTTTAGSSNQFSAITGGGVNGSANYGIANPGSSSVSRINFASATVVEGAYFTNTTYAYLSMRDGDAFAKQFSLNDFFTLTVTGLDAFDSVTNSVNISLARDANLVDAWIWNDLMPLGEVYALEFSLSSSDVGAFGMNTPAYFAIDNLTTVSAVPVPAAVWLFGSGLLGLVAVARRR